MFNSAKISSFVLLGAVSAAAIFTTGCGGSRESEPQPILFKVNSCRFG